MWFEHICKSLAVKLHFCSRNSPITFRHLELKYKLAKANVQNDFTVLLEAYWFYSPKFNLPEVIQILIPFPSFMLEVPLRMEHCSWSIKWTSRPIDNERMYSIYLLKFMLKLKNFYLWTYLIWVMLHSSLCNSRWNDYLFSTLIFRAVCKRTYQVL